MSRTIAVPLAGALLAGSAMTQTVWYLRGSDASMRVVGEAVRELRGPRAMAADLPAGAYELHFATDALGQPASLSLEVPDRAVVHVAVAPAAAAAAREVPLAGEGWTEATGGANPGWIARCSGGADAGDYRVAATCSAGGSAGACGLVARWRSAEHHYRFVWDRAAAEFRLERVLGKDTIVLARGPAAVAAARAPTLALQVVGFRLQAFCDDALVLQALDGAFAAGAFGTWTAGPPVVWQRVTLEAPAPARASSALVREAAVATFQAATEVVPGHYHVLELRLDRPHALVPLRPNGHEEWLLQRPAAPQVLLADWRGSLGAAGLGEVGRTGTFASEVRWPALVGLLGQVALVRALLVSPDGEATVAATPAVPLRF
jgi:hypothetical protein